MSPWENVLIALSSSSALLAVLGFLAKSLFEKVIARDTKVFEAQLRAHTDTEIEKFKNSLARDVESYKVKLKKSEVFFLRELDAASSFSSFFHSLLPGYTHPNIGWHEACDELARSFGQIEIQLKSYMEKHCAVLTEDERTVIVDATSDAGYGKFEIRDGDVEPSTNEKASSMYAKLEELEATLMARVRTQASL